MGLSDQTRRWLDCIGLSAISYCRLDRIISPTGFYQETLDFMRWLVAVWMGKMGWMGWMGRWWDGGGMDRC